MKTAFKILMGVVLLIGIAGIALYAWARTNPSDALDLAIALERQAAGLEEQSVEAGGTTWPYLEGGDPANPTIVLLHGFGADKDNWLRFAKLLTPSYHVVIPDLPGFGEHAPRAEWRYDINSHVPRLEAFVAKLGLNRFDLAGNSMGGNMTASYALAHPQRVKSLGLFCPAGVPEPQPSRLTQELGSDKNALVPRTRAQYAHLIDLVFVKTPPMPEFLGAELADRAIAQADFRERAFTEYRTNFVDLTERLPEIQQPSLVLWGDEDGLIHVSAAPVWDAQLPNSQLVVLEGVGHAPMIEVPKVSADIYVDFLNSAR